MVFYNSINGTKLGTFLEIMSFLRICLGVCLLIVTTTASCGKMDSPDAYRCAAREELFRAKARTENKRIAKNLAIFIGDGMGLPSVTAGRIFQGQKDGQTGEEYKLFFETFPNVGLSKTYNSDKQVPDSAGTATAIFSGVKANYGTLGVDNRVPYGKDCTKLSRRTKVKTIVDHALAAGKSVGIVTNARMTHATPAASYAHLPYRYWESNTDISSDAVGCNGVKDVALQLIEDNRNIQVLMGGGRRSFLNNTTPDPNTGSIDSHQRTDGRDLIEEWKADKKRRGKKFSYVDTKGKLDNVDADKTEYLFGLFQSGHMTYETERDDSPAGEPSVTDMASKAIDILKKNKKGFLLIVEGARIDHAHHKNEAKRALTEVGEFDRAIMSAQDKLNHEDTLTVVTADHSHVFGIAGYPSRGNDILGLVDWMDDGEEPNDGMPFTTLTYSNGPEVGRTNLTLVDTTTDTFRYPSCIEMPWETHGGEDVSIYALGPMSHMFHTTHEQNYIAHVMMYAACIGDYKTDINCDRFSREMSTHGAQTNGRCCATGKVVGHLVLALCILFVVLLMF